MKFDPGKHIIGKVYDLTQENMNAMIKEIERQRELIEEVETHSAALKIISENLWRTL